MFPRIKKSIGVTDDKTMVLVIQLPDKDTSKEEKVKYITDTVYRRVHAMYLSGPRCMYSGTLSTWNNDFRKHLNLESVKIKQDKAVVMLTIPKRFQDILTFISQLKLFELTEEDVSTPEDVHNLNQRIENNRANVRRSWHKFFKQHPEYRPDNW